MVDELASRTNGVGKKIRPKIVAEANSKVKCENENPLPTEATRSKSELSLRAFPLLFPNQTGHCG